MHYIVYKTTNAINGKIYVGCHKTKNLEDGYIGSGYGLKRALKKYGKINFKREILHILENEQSMFLKEAELVNADFVARTDTYNMTAGGKGGWAHVKGGFGGRKHTAESKEKIAKKIRGNKNLLGKVSPMKGKKRSAEFSDKIRAFRIAHPHSKEINKKISESLKRHHGLKNNLDSKPRSNMQAARAALPAFLAQSTKDKIAEATRKRWLNSPQKFDWNAIQDDCDKGFTRAQIYSKYEINRHQLYDAIKLGRIIANFKKRACKDQR
jgi:hypothetical protein